MAQNDPIFVSNPVVQPTPEKPGTAKSAAIAGGAASASMIALALAVAGLKPDEGYRQRTYLDVAGIPTECYGHRDDAAKVGTYHTAAQCTALLSSDVSKTLGAVKKCTPQIAAKPEMLAAATRLAYNIGTGAYCRSSVAKYFKAGKFKAGCYAFLDWRFAAGKPILLPRREREEAECLKGI